MNDPSHSEVSRDRARRALVVDDSELVGKAMEILLEARGFDVLTVDSCAGALAVIRTEPLCLAVIDEFLLDGRGSTLVPHLRRLQPRTRIVFITATELAGDVARISQRGVDAIFTKPVDSTLFLERLAELLPEAGGRAQEQADSGQPNGGPVRGSTSPCPFGEFRPYAPSRFPAESPGMINLRRRLTRVLEFQGSVALCGHQGAAYARIAREFHEASSLARTPLLLVSGPIPGEIEIRDQLSGADVRVGPVTLCILRQKGLLEDDLARIAQLKVEGVAGGRVRIILCTTSDTLDELEQSGTPIGLQLSSLSFEIPSLQELRSDLATLARGLLKEGARSSSDLPVDLDPAALSWIEDAAWEGDFAEFETLVLRAQRRSGGNLVTVADLAGSVSSANGVAG